MRQIRRRQFGARLTARFALYFALIGVLPGALIYVLSVQFMSRSIESWFNVRVDSALEAGLNLGRAALDSQLGDLNARAKEMAGKLSNASDTDMVMAITRLRERSEEHTSELQSLMRISYAVFCLKKKKQKNATRKLI